MKQKLTPKKARKICQDFANKHKVIFNDEGECGFGRECVGFESGERWIDFNPYKHPDYTPIEELQCDGVLPPDGVNNYHKHDCLAVLGRGEEAVMQLARWVLSMESKGDVKIITYNTGATGMQAMFTDFLSKAVVVYPKK